MSLLSPNLAQAPFDPKAHWITPEKQLELLQKPLVEKITAALGLARDVANIVAGYAADPRLTSWHTGLKLIEKLPEKIPPLPGHISQILNNKCPEEICDKKKSDGSFYTLGEKCTLTLVPEELESINKFQRVVKSYGEKQYSKGENPLQFRFFDDSAQVLYWDVAFKPTHWELQTEDVLARNKNWETQAAEVDSLAKKTLVGWEVPELQGTLAAIFIKKIATGESILNGKEQIGCLPTYTRVKEMTAEGHVLVGGCDPSGVTVSSHSDYLTYDNFGVVARWKS
jgi:hypothetical protein